MEPSLIIPDLQCSLLCEDVRQESSGKFIIIGVVDRIRVPRVPVTAMRLCLFNRWTAGIGKFKETARILKPDQTSILQQVEVSFQLKDTNRHATNIAVFRQINFPEIGTYYVEIMIAEMMKLRFPVVIQVPPSPPTSKPAP